jgi:plasmid stabilization system protein ParE
MQVRFAAVARDELVEERAWLNRQQPGLGARLNDEVCEATKRIARMPLMFPVDVADVRRCHLHRFPYTLRYALRNDTVLIVAVSHQHRQPDYWIDRTKE